MKKSIMGLLFAILPLAAGAQTIKLETSLVSREFDVSNHHLKTVGYKLAGDDHNFVYVSGENTDAPLKETIPACREFSFLLNDELYTGLSEWDISQRDTTGTDKSVGMIFTLRSKQTKGLVVELIYATYPDVPVIRKQMRLYNQGSTDFKIENLDTEHLYALNHAANGGAWILRSYGRYRMVGPYVGNADDPVLLFYEPDRQCGMVVGNEAPGVVKRSSMLEDGYSVTAGLTHKDQDFAFRKWLAPGESWLAPAVFTAVFHQTSNPTEVLETTVSDYVRRYMGVRFEALEKKPMFVYNTWSPFTKNVNEKLIDELSEATAQCGVEEFIIDDGWQVDYGDWRVNKEKFPNGLKGVFDHVKRLGMKPGLWITLATSGEGAPVFKEHPEWFVKDSTGDFCNLHWPANEMGWIKTACMTTGYADYITDVIKGLAKDHGLAYAKLDFAVTASAYIYDKHLTGCYASHPGHRDCNESYLSIYDACTNVFEQLHKEIPDLFIDCTYETAGRWHLNDYGLAKYAEGNWLSNISDGCNGVAGVLRIRQLAWQRTPAIPASTLVLGHLAMDGPKHLLSLKSLVGTIPVMVGDPRNLSGEEREEYKMWTTWLKGVQARHGFMSFRQDLPGFGEPAEGSWDGYMRINTETRSGGLIGVFRHGSKEHQRIVTVKYLDPEQYYEIHEGGTDKLLHTMKGDELANTGFSVRLDQDYDGQLFELRRK